VALLYLDGKGIEANPAKAAYWLKQAAYKKLRPAQYELGKMYFDGNGVKQNNIRAYAWLDIALREQNDATPALLDSLINNMEPKTREMALELRKRYEVRYMQHSMN
jgi:TPR repeat protein